MKTQKSQGARVCVLLRLSCAYVVHIERNHGFYLRFVFACLRVRPHPPRKEWLYYTWAKKSLRVLFGVPLRVLVPSCFCARGCARGASWSYGASGSGLRFVIPRHFLSYEMVCVSSCCPFWYSTDIPRVSASIPGEAVLVDSRGPKPLVQLES